MTKYPQTGRGQVQGPNFELTFCVMSYSKNELGQHYVNRLYSSVQELSLSICDIQTESVVFTYRQSLLCLPV